MGMASVVVGIVAWADAARAQEQSTRSLSCDPAAEGGASAQELARLAECRLEPLPDPASPPETVWYGWETLLHDGLATGVFLAGRKTHQAALAWIGAGLYAVGGPATHGERGREDKVRLDVALRLMAPVVGSLLAEALLGPPRMGDAAAPRPTGQNFHVLADGAAAGAVAAMLIDAYLIAFTQAEPAGHDADASRAVRWSPSVGAAPHGGTLRVEGAF